MDNNRALEFRSALGMRRVLAVGALVVFGAVAFAGAFAAGLADGHRTAWAVTAAVCTVVALTALVDLRVISRRRLSRE